MHDPLWVPVTSDTGIMHYVEIAGSGLYLTQSPGKFTVHVFAVPQVILDGYWGTIGTDTLKGKPYALKGPDSMVERVGIIIDPHQWADLLNTRLSNIFRRAVYLPIMPIGPIPRCNWIDCLSNRECAESEGWIHWPMNRATARTTIALLASTPYALGGI